MWFVPLPGPRAPEMGGFGNGMCAPLVLGASRFGAAVGRRERHNIFGKKKKKSSNGVKTREERLKVSCKGLGGRGQVVGG